MDSIFPTRQVALTNDYGHETGALDIYQAHTYPCHLHKAPSVWLVNDDKHILLQKRSQRKPIGAGWWGNGICGNVLPGESYEECAHRRLEQELGIMKVELNYLYAFTYKAYGNEKYGECERDQVYLGTYNGQAMPNPDEVEEVMWVDAPELRAQVKSVEYISPKETLRLSKEELKEKTPPVTLHLNDRAVEVTPWTFMMFKDSRLQEILFA